MLINPIKKLPFLKMTRNMKTRLSYFFEITWRQDSIIKNSDVNHLSQWFPSNLTFFCATLTFFKMERKQ